MGYISGDKLDCINRCFEGNIDEVKFYKPPTELMCMLESAKIQCHECKQILKNADAYKKHVCPSIEKEPEDIKQMLAKIK